MADAAPDRPAPELGDELLTRSQPAVSGPTHSRSQRSPPEVAMSPAVPLPVMSARTSFLVIIGVDLHNRTPRRARWSRARMHIGATLAGYRS